jgi:hypothetical protein
MFNSGNIRPFWNIEEFKSLDYKYDVHKDTDLVDLYETSGHHRPSISMYNYFEPNPMPDTIYNYIVKHFDLDHVAVAVNYFKPGQYIPVHTDLFQKYMEVHSVAYEDIIRTIVMLEDCSPGQISQVDQVTMGNWKAGDWFQWCAPDPHAFYNFSMQDRYAIQITGVKKQLKFNLVVDNTK